jgi:thiol-disulfide isomerase/thioredoxin
MPRKRSTKIGALDVRSQNEVSDLEKMISIGPLTLVLVYADWCGHCHNFKEKMWNEVNTIPNKSVNTASVHYDMLDKTSLANSKIEGYPSLLLVGTDKKPADFVEEDGTKTNAMPPPANVSELKSIVQTPLPTPVRNANSVAQTIVNRGNMGPEEEVVEAVSVKPNSVETVTEVAEETPMNVVSNNKNRNTVSVSNVISNNKNRIMKPSVVNAPSFKPANVESLGVPPDALTDLVESQRRQPSSETQSGGGARGGGLYAALLEVTREAAPAAFLLAAASLKAKHRKTRSKRKNSKKTLRKRR